jgi:DNA replication and repair protein RecF
MRLRNLELRNWRNFVEARVAWPEGLTVVVGANAQGKTNLLEAVYTLASGKPFRALRDEEVIRFGADTAEIAGEVERASGVFRLTWSLTRGGRRRHARDGRSFRPGADPLGDLRVILFAPEDLELAKGPAEARRAFLDRDVGGLSAVYLHELQVYRRGLTQRNALLRRGPTEDELAVWDRVLLRAGLAVTRWRRRLVDALRPYFKDAYAAMAAGEEARLEYRPNLADDPEEVLHHVARLRPAELARGVTLWGPHRDDIVLWIGDNEARTYASQGQQRTLALALKMAALRHATAVEGERPLLLLDDVLSELDAKRRTALARLLGEGQTILTTTDRDGVPGLEVAKFVHVEAGKVMDDGRG